MRLLAGSCLVALVTACHGAASPSSVVLGLDDRGIIAPGKLADLVVVEGNPAAHIEDADRITSVWHRGRKIPAP